jgi:ATP synthase protein I
MAEPRGGNEAWRSAWSIGFNFAAAVAGFLFIGYAIDRYYGTGPWGVLICTFLGLVGGMYNMIRQALAASKQATREADRQRSAPKRGES